jgi:LPXTG-site transpeptidase (sortase) family protein
MQLKIPPRRKLLVFIIVGSIFLLVVISYFVRKKLTLSIGNQVQNNLLLSTDNIVIPLPSNPAIIIPPVAQVNYGLPVRLKIPSINVDAIVEYVGLTASGDMDVPKKPDDVAWFERGWRPGENGSAVIAGHYGTWKNGQGSVFDNLYKLRAGDKIFIEDDKKSTISFVVVSLKNYDPKANASNVFYSNDGKAHLNLITCEGVWNQSSQSYPNRLVVFTDKE